MKLSRIIDKPSNVFDKYKRSLLNNKKKCAIAAFLLIAVVLVSVFAFIQGENKSPIDAADPQGNDPTPTPSPTQNQPEPTKPTRKPSDIPIISDIAAFFEPPKGFIESHRYANSTVWKEIATNAWNYFRLDRGVMSKTGLPCAGYEYYYFTDWDLGVYIQAIVDAQSVGLIGTEGEWGSLARIDKVLTFLETRKLNQTTGYPFWFYDARDGSDYHPKNDFAGVNVCDTGRLLVALGNCKTYAVAIGNHDLTDRIDNFVYNKAGNRSDYAALVPGIKTESMTSKGIYAYYVAYGFASFFNEVSDAPERILNNILNAGNVSTFGVELPKGEISCEPLLAMLFEGKPNVKLQGLAWQVYLAHEARYNNTKEYVAFSEGNGFGHFMYEWVVLPNGDVWKIRGTDQQDLDVEPIIYNKVALSFLALYNTTYAYDTAVYLEQSLPAPQYHTGGYCEGATYWPESHGRQLLALVGSNTNGLILGAACYALGK